jgi:hypothetical protein
MINKISELKVFYSSKAKIGNRSIKITIWNNLATPNGSDNGDQFALFDREGNVCKGIRRCILAPPETGVHYSDDFSFL